MNTFGLYHPGASVLHRLPAGAKLLAVAVLILVLTLWIRQPWQVLPALALAVLAYAAARIPPRLAAVQLRPLAWMLAIIAAFQVLVAGWERAVVICGSLLVAVALAALVTLTTRTTDMLDAIVRAKGAQRDELLEAADAMGQRFGELTRDAVFTFQNNFGLPVTGVVDANVFFEIERAYRDAVSDLPPDYQSAIGEPYPGRFIIEGDRGESVRIIQRYLNVVAQGNPSIPTIAVDGIFGPRTKAAVTAFQRSLGIEQNGAVGPAEWAELVIRGNNL